jgi:oligoribonuclease
MTGLDATKDTIMSIACFVTDAQLNLLDETGYETAVHHSSQDLAKMGEWCTRTHTASGLVDLCVMATTDAQAAANRTLQYIKQLIPQPGRALLAGNSIHADKMFLMHEPWKQILDHLHYRLLDVSAIKEAARRWAPDEVLENVPKKQLKHEAKADILESIEEARYYRSLFGNMRQSSSSPPNLIGSQNSTSTLDSAYDRNKAAPASFLRKDSYGNTITQEAEQVEATLKAKRKAGEMELQYPLVDGSRRPNGRGLRTISGGLQASNSIDSVGSDPEGFRTDVP